MRLGWSGKGGIISSRAVNNGSTDAGVTKASDARGEVNARTPSTNPFCSPAALSPQSCMGSSSIFGSGLRKSKSSSPSSERAGGGGD